MNVEQSWQMGTVNYTFEGGVQVFAIQFRSMYLTTGIVSYMPTDSMLISA